MKNKINTKMENLTPNKLEASNIAAFFAERVKNAHQQNDNSIYNPHVLCAILSDSFENLSDYGNNMPSHVFDSNNILMKLISDSDLPVVKKIASEEYLEKSFNTFLMGLQYRDLFFCLSQEFAELSEIISNLEITPKDEK